MSLWVSSAHSRWTRLERFARWKQPRMKLTQFPDDVLVSIASLLSQEDVLSLVMAFTGSPISFRDWREEEGEGKQTLPSCLRPVCIVSLIETEFKKHVNSIADYVLYHIRSPLAGAHVVGVMNWSEFSPDEPNVLVEFEWRHKRATVVIRYENLHKQAQLALNRGLPVGRFTLHDGFTFTSRDENRIVKHVFPTPLHVSNYTLFPNELLRMTHPVRLPVYRC